MASATTKPSPKRASRTKGTGKSNGSKASPKAKRPTYDERVKRISDKARAMACPQSMQGPVPKQCLDIMTTLRDPREAIASVDLTQKELKAIATGNASSEAKAKLRPLVDRCGQGGRREAMGSRAKPRGHLGCLAEAK